MPLKGIIIPFGLFSIYSPNNLPPTNLCTSELNQHKRKETMFKSTPSPLSYQELRNIHYTRRLLLHNRLYQTPRAAASPPGAATNTMPPTEPYGGNSGFDANVVMVLSVLLCALICSLGINSIIKCALRCSLSRTESNRTHPPDQLAHTGIKKKALKTFAIVNYSPDLKLPGLGTECVICLSEFNPGEKVRLLPKCNHGFHARCIDKWLNSHSSCPTCRHSLIDQACQKIGGCDQASSSQPQRSQATTINIEPLEHEDLARSNRCTS
uniref:RING-type E3 ubiquitin transferase n=1 Tax=Opuntia streptacantha TaxID=393608 RepID=A0A7C9A050_OPUST